MSNVEFQVKFERKIHLLIVTANIVLVGAALVLNTYHTATNRSFCHFAATPHGCREHRPQQHENNNDSKNACDPVLTQRVDWFIFVNVFLLFLFTGTLIVTIMTMLGCHAHYMRKLHFHSSKKIVPRRNHNYLEGETHQNDDVENDHITRHENNNDHDHGNNHSTSISRSSNVNQQMIMERERDEVINIQPTATTTTTTTATTNNNKNRKEERREQTAVGNEESVDHHLDYTSNLYRREITIQAFLYVGAFALTYLPLCLSFFILLTSQKSKAIGTTLLIITSFFFPLGGVWNILIYVRPKVSMLCREFPEEYTTYAQGLWVVLKSGCEVPSSIRLKQQRRQRQRSPLNAAVVIHAGDVSVDNPVIVQDKEGNESIIRRIRMNRWIPRRTNNPSEEDGNQLMSVSSNNHHHSMILSSSSPQMDGIDLKHNYGSSEVDMMDDGEALTTTPTKPRKILQLAGQISRSKQINHRSRRQQQQHRHQRQRRRNQRRQPQRGQRGEEESQDEEKGVNSICGIDGQSLSFGPDDTRYQQESNDTNNDDDGDNNLSYHSQSESKTDHQNTNHHHPSGVSSSSTALSYRSHSFGSKLSYALFRDYFTGDSTPSRNVSSSMES